MHGIKQPIFGGGEGVKKGKLQFLKKDIETYHINVFLKIK